MSKIWGSYQKSNFLFIGLIMIGMILRTPFTSIPPILTDIAHGLHIEVSSLGILTTIPLLMFAFCSPIAPRISQKFGIAKTFAGVLILLMVGSFLRIVNVPFLFIGTAILGMGIAMLNVLMPSAVMTYFPNKIGKLTAIYTTVMTCATALMSALSVPIAQHSFWKTMIIVLTVLLAITFIIWFPNVKQQKSQIVVEDEKQSSKVTKESAWKTPKAWIMLTFSGLQSTGLTWLPTMIEAISIRKRQLVMLLFNVLGIIGVAMLFCQQSSFTYWLIVSLLIGCDAGALFPYLMTTFSLKATTSERSAELSGMSQSGGYLIASIGPFLFGYGHTLFHSWTFVTSCFLVLTIIMAVMNFLLEREEKIF